MNVTNSPDRVLLKHKCTMTGDCCVFKSFRHTVDEKRQRLFKLVMSCAAFLINIPFKSCLSVTLVCRRNALQVSVIISSLSYFLVARILELLFPGKWGSYFIYTVTSYSCRFDEVILRSWPHHRHP